MLKWILLIVIVVAFPAEVGRLLADLVVIARDTFTVLIAAFNNKGIQMIRFIVGLVIVFGAVGTLDIDPEANVLLQTALAGAGLALMYFGSEKMKQY